jgi:hypothetical protein
MSSTDLRSQLAADDGSLPDRWNPDDEPGTTLVGELVGWEDIVTDFGPAKIAVIEDEEDGHRWGVALFRSVLKKRFETLDPRVGDTIGLKYVGVTPPRTKGGNEYHNYVMKVIPAVGSRSTTRAESAEEEGELPF